MTMASGPYFDFTCVKRRTCTSNTISIHVWGCVWSAVCDHLFQGVGRVRCSRSLFNAGKVCVFLRTRLLSSVCVSVSVSTTNAYVHGCFWKYVCVCACVWVATRAEVCECVSFTVCLAVLYYITLNYNWGGNVTACDLILITSITFSKGRVHVCVCLCICACLILCVCVCVCGRVYNLPMPIKGNVTAWQTYSSILKCDDLIMAHLRGFPVCVCMCVCVIGRGRQKKVLGKCVCVCGFL